MVLVNMTRRCLRMMTMKARNNKLRSYQIRLCLENTYNWRMPILPSFSIKADWPLYMKNHWILIPDLSFFTVPVLRFCRTIIDIFSGRFWLESFSLSEASIYPTRHSLLRSRKSVNHGSIFHFPCSKVYTHESTLTFQLLVASTILIVASKGKMTDFCPSNETMDRSSVHRSMMIYCRERSSDTDCGWYGSVESETNRSIVIIPSSLSVPSVWSTAYFPHAVVPMGLKSPENVAFAFLKSHDSSDGSLWNHGIRLYANTLLKSAW